MILHSCPASNPCGGLTRCFNGDTIDIPGVGIVGHSTPRELCEACAARNHRECTGFAKSGELCACDCREA